MTRSKRISSPPWVCIGSASVSPFWMSASGMPWSSRFIFEMDQTPPLFSWPNRARFRALPPCSSTYSLERMSMPPGSRARVVDAHPLSRFDQADHHPDDGSRGVELAALLAGRVGELADEVLVGGTEQVGELEVLVAQPVLGEVDDQVAQLLVRRSTTGPPCG